VRYDVLVLGGGSAGCVLAARLSEDENRTVCLVEAGPDYGPRANWPAELLDPLGIPETHQWDASEAPSTPFRSKVLGGCSTHNACLLVWDDDLVELEKYRDRALATIAPEPFFYSEDDLTPWFAAVASAGRERGVEVVRGPFNIRDGLRWNAALAYLEPARSRPNLTIRANAQAERVLPDGAIVDGDEVRADIVIVSAGTVGSPRILLRSGIDAGSNLQDHITARLVFDTGDALSSDEPLPFTNGFLKTPDLHLLPVQDRFGTRAHITVSVLRPHARGFIDLERIDHRLLSDERDRQALQDGFDLARELAEHKAIRSIGRPTSASIDETLGVYFHPVGTCSDVVGNDFRVHGFDNLYVCDASVLDPIPRANTHLPTLALAEKLGSEL
jgi:choline dehydrogenase